MIGIRIPKNDNKSLDNKMINYLDPNYVYIKYNGEDVIELKKDDNVKIGTKLGINNKTKLPILSSISGIIIEINDNYIIIKNDFKEEIAYQKEDIKTKEDFNDLLKNTSIIGMGGAGFPTYLKYENDKFDTLIVNAVECEPFITADYQNSIININNIINAILKIMEIYDLKECFIAVKGHNRKLVEIITTNVNKYSNIKVVNMPNLYPMGWERSIVRYIKHVDYDKIPSEKGIVVSNISTINAIGEAIDSGKPLVDRIVTFTGNCFEKNVNVKVKIGTKISDIVEKIGYKDTKKLLIDGGPMMGKSLENDDYTITSKTNCIMCIDYKEEKENPCLRCGKCNENCPVKIKPVLIKDNINTLNLKRLHPEKCISCGICSYICPAKINLRKIVNEAKRKVR